MKTTQRINMATIYDSVAESFRSSGEFAPSHCDVRCAVNDALESYRRDGCAVCDGYSQDRAFLPASVLTTSWKRDVVAILWAPST